MSRRTTTLTAAALVAGLAAVLGFGPAASAAPKPIGVSADGASYADALPAPLFAGALIVPGASVTRSFWVQNRASSAGNLAVALQGVSGADAAFLAALSVRATSGATTGPTVAFPAASPCASLLSGIVLAPGATARVDVRLTLSASLSGEAAQGSTGVFDLGLTLTSTDVPALSGCTGAPPTGGTGGTGGGPGGPGGTGDPGGTGSTPPAPIGIAVIAGSAEGSLPAAPHSLLPSASGEGIGVSAMRTIPNTGRFLQEFDASGYLVALVLGGLVAWRRGRREDEEEEH